MKMNWLATTAIAFMFGTGAVAAQQSDHAQKHEERAAPHAQTQEQKTQPDHHAAADQTKGQTTGKAEQKAGEPRSDEASAKGDHHKQAQQHENKEPTRKSEEQQGRDERAATSKADEHKGHDSTTGQASDEHRGREAQKSEHAQDTKRPGKDTGQTTGQAQSSEGQKGEHAKNDEHAKDEKGSSGITQQSQQKKDSSEQADQGSKSSTQQSEREHGAQAAQQQQGANTGQATDHTSQHAEINSDQRHKIVDQLRSKSTTHEQNVNIRVNVGERLPQRVDVQRLPPDIVTIAPQYRGDDYTVIDNRIAIVNPSSREVVAYIDEDSDQGRTASYGSDHVVVSADVRDRFRKLARRSSTGTVGSTESASGGGTCLSLQQVPEDLVHDHPELSKYRYLTIGDEAVLVDPQQHKIVQVID